MSIYSNTAHSRKHPKEQLARGSFPDTKTVQETVRVSPKKENGDLAALRTENEDLAGLRTENRDLAALRRTENGDLAALRRA